MGQCLSAHEIKAQPSRHTKIAERAFGAVRVTSPVGQISEATLRDGERLIVRLAQLKDQEVTREHSQCMTDDHFASPSPDEEETTPLGAHEHLRPLSPTPPPLEPAAQGAPSPQDTKYMASGQGFVTNEMLM